MPAISRRQFLTRSALGTAALACTPLVSGWTTSVPKMQNELVFQPYPHPLRPELSFAYVLDDKGDPYATVDASAAGVVISDAVADRPFALSTRWFIEGFGYVWLEADNGGRYFTRDDFRGARPMNLNFEFARTQVARNAERLARYRGEGATFTAEVRHLDALAQELLEDANKQQGERAGNLADQSLLYGLWAAEKIELEKARSDIDRMNRRRGEQVYFGCETRQYVWIKSEDMVERFVELFNYATVTHYVYDTWYEVFEPTEGVHRWGIKDNIVDWLTENDITVEGRPLLWFHPWVTPDWLKEKNFDELKQYVDNHVEALVGHYGDRVLHWEVVNEYHDWANIHRHTPEQITELVRLACEKTHEVNPDVVRIINNCCPYGDYASYNYDASGEAPRKLRTPRKYLEDLTEAAVPFEVVGVQIYFPERSLADIVRMIERFETFGKPVHITEIGTSSGPTRLDVMKGEEVPGAPYDWHRPWDQDLQADWMEQLYTILYSKPWIEAVNWYDFADFRTFIPNGGLIREDGTPKLSHERMKALLGRWDRLPDRG